MYNSADIAEIIKKTAREKGIQLKDMLFCLNLNKNTLSSMYNGSMPKSDNLARIADYLDCSVDYLLGRTPTPSPARQVESTFTPAEQELVGRYRRASGDDRAIVDMALRKYASPSRTEQVG